MPLTFALLLNLVGVALTDDKNLLWAFVQRYAPEASPETHPELDALIGHAAVYFRDFVKDSLNRRAPDGREAEALRDLRSEEHTSELQSLMRISYAVFCLKKKKQSKAQQLHKIMQ